MPLSSCGSSSTSNPFLHVYHKRCLELARQSPCLKRRYGAIVAATISSCGGLILGEGFNRSVATNDCHTCLRLAIPSGTQLERCWAIHAEQGALIEMLRHELYPVSDLIRLDLWACGALPDGSPAILERPFFSCSLCARMAMACGITHIVLPMRAGPVWVPMSTALDQAMQVARGECDASGQVLNRADALALPAVPSHTGLGDTWLPHWPMNNRDDHHQV